MATATETASTATPQFSPFFTTILGFVPGAVGGTCNVVVGHPIDLVKVRQQTSFATPASVTTTTTARSAAAASGGNGAATATLVPPAPRQGGTLSMLRHIAVYEGMPGLYAGVAAPLLAVVPAFAISFGSYDLARRTQLSYTNRTELTLGQVAIAGGCSGVPLAAVVGPLDRIKCLMQVHPERYAGLTDCVRAVYAQGGWRSCVRGTGVTLLRDVPGNAAYFATYETIKRTFKFYVPEPSATGTTLMTLFAGGMSGVMNWIVAIPMDVVKSRWQTAEPGAYRGPAHVLRVLLQTDGPTALFRGLGPALWRAFPANAACLLGFETASTLLKKTLGET